LELGINRWGHGSPSRTIFNIQTQETVQNCSIFSGFFLRGGLGRWVVGANMRGKIPVALQLKIPHHFVKRCARGCTRSHESPAALGASKTPKTLFFNPNQFSTHGGPCWCGQSTSAAGLVHGLPPGRSVPSRGAYERGLGGAPCRELTTTAASGFFRHLYPAQHDNAVAVIRVNS